MSNTHPMFGHQVERDSSWISSSANAEIISMRTSSGLSTSCCRSRVIDGKLAALFKPHAKSEEQNIIPSSNAHCMAREAF